MSIEDDIAFFEQAPTLALLGRQALRILAIGAESQRLQSGAVLFYAGDPADGGYIIQSGSLLLQPDRPTEGIGDITAGPGTLLGELALLTDTVRPATATALESSIVMRISRSLFLKMLEGYPGGAAKLRDLMAKRVDQWTREIANVRNALDTRDAPSFRPDERG
jgi:CRP-like cAMP-binding protein